jgi:PKD repeat protein
MKRKILLATLIILSLIAMSLPVMAQPKPTADFYGAPRYGSAPLSVQFWSTDVTNNPTEYVWVFEPQASRDWNSHHPRTAVHTFRNPGVYDISLVVTNKAGSTTITKPGYITVV